MNSLSSVCFSFFLILYSWIFNIVARLLKLGAIFSPKLRSQLNCRSSVKDIGVSLARERAKYRHCALFFCSSAGEFEQAKPLIQRLQAIKTVYVQVIFFSKSGIDFVRARGETVASCLAPISDSVWQWGWLFSALLPDFTCIVRHELWPGFITTARQFGKLYLIDASRSISEQKSKSRRMVRRILLRQFDRIYTVSDDDKKFFNEFYRLPEDQLLVTSDTKYDRVSERARSKPELIRQFRETFDQTFLPQSSKRLVIGSAYHQELELMLQVLEKHPSLAHQWQVVIVPHVLRESDLNWMKQRIGQCGFICRKYSELNTEGLSKTQFIIVDVMGILAEIYGTAEAAFVGGALHNQVHNVLEPASHGLAIAFGPFYKNSQEAIHLVNNGLAMVVRNTEEFSSWLQHLSNQSSSIRHNMLEAMASLIGASDRVLATWRPLLDH